MHNVGYFYNFIIYEPNNIKLMQREIFGKSEHQNMYLMGRLREATDILLGVI